MFWRISRWQQWRSSGLSEQDDWVVHQVLLQSDIWSTIKHSFASTVGESIISQLRTGYVGLNDYLHKCNFKDSDLCKCGAKETVSHYLLECNEFDTARELMRKKLFETCGIIHLDMNLLLDAKQDDIYKDWRSDILSELENFVAETRRFATQT